MEDHAFPRGGSCGPVDNNPKRIVRSERFLTYGRVMVVSTDESGLALTPVDYLILGLVGWLEPCTSYDLKREVQRTVSSFWTFSHTALYQAPPQLVAAGLLAVEQEDGGRRRRLDELTPAGRAEPPRWLGETPA